MINKKLIYTTIIVCLAMSLVSCPTDGGGPIVVPGMIDVAGVSGDTYTQTDGTNSFVHNISSFEIGEYEVTYSLWRDVLSWAEGHSYIFAADTGREGNDGVIYPLASANSEPVTAVSWRDAIVWCNAYSEQLGLAPCYLDATNAILKDSTNAAACDTAVCVWSNTGFRLPTEGEWQVAASNYGGTPWNYASGATMDITNTAETGAVAWYSANSGGQTKDVGTITDHNALALWDMSGNVFEWCWDWIDTYPSTAQTDYQGPGTGTNRIIRGGSWSFGATQLQIGYRVNLGPGTQSDGVGFRLARTN